LGATQHGVVYVFSPKYINNINDKIKYMQNNLNYMGYEGILCYALVMNKV
jgi:hypothetical protein